MKKSFMTEKRRNRLFSMIVTLCIVLFAIAVAPKSLQNDTFYTIKIGEYIMQNGGSDLTQDTFSWHELPYTYPHWLYDFGIYVIYHFWGQDRNLYFNNIANGNLGWNNLFVK